MLPLGGAAEEQQEQPVGIEQDDVVDTVLAELQLSVAHGSRDVAFVGRRVGPLHLDHVTGIDRVALLGKTGQQPVQRPVPLGMVIGQYADLRRRG